MSDFKNLLANLGIVFLAINTIIYIKSYRLKSIAFKMSIFYLLFTLVIQLISGYLSDNKKPNLHLSHYYFIGQFLLLSFFFKKILTKRKQIKIINYFLILILVTLGFYYYKNPEMYYQFNQLEIILTSVPLLLYSLFFFIQKIDDSNKQFLYITSGLFIYLLCSTLLFVSGDIGGGSSLKVIIWYLNSILYLVYQILIFIEWYKNFRKPKKDYKT